KRTSVVQYKFESQLQGLPEESLASIIKENKGGNIIAGIATALAQIITGRLIAGIGGAGLMSLSIVVICQLIHERQRASYMNIINVVFIISDALGPVLGGVFSRSGNWRWIFLLNAPFGPVNIRTFRDVVTKVDIVGMFLLVASLSFLIVTLNSA
ncbi:hypothetical protein MPER_03448, partial [Moniliophthora perniciosa FA553]